MRTTIDIDEDILAAAKELARAEGKTMSQVISELARRALTTPTDTGAAGGFGDAAQTPFRVSSWPTLPNREGVIVTSEMVERIQDELDHEDGDVIDHDDSADFEPRRPGERGRLG